MLNDIMEEFICLEHWGYLFLIFNVEDLGYTELKNFESNQFYSNLVLINLNNPVLSNYFLNYLKIFAKILPNK